MQCLKKNITEKLNGSSNISKIEYIPKSARPEY